MQQFKWVKPNNEAKKLLEPMCLEANMQTKFSDKYGFILSGLNFPNYKQPNLKEPVSGEEKRGNLACVGAA